MSSPSLRRAGVFLVFSLMSAACGKEAPVAPEQQVSLIEIAPTSALMYAVGQTKQFKTTLTTEAGTDGEGIAITYTSRDNTLLQVSATGLATALKKGGTTYVVATAGGKSDSALVQVAASTCTTTPTTMAVGQVVTDIGDAGFCAAASTGEFAVIVHNTSFAASGFTSLEVTPIGVSTPPGSSASFSRGGLQSDLGKTIRPWKRNVAAEMRFRRQEAIVAAPFAATARSWYANRKRASRSVATPSVGDKMHINVSLSGSACGDSTPVDARVTAVSNNAIILEDPRNPSDGYTDAEYRAFAQSFDASIFPLDTTQFGTPTDLDANQRVLLVFTRAVNELTPPNVNYYVGGLTYSRDLLPIGSGPGNGTTYCQTGNQAEMFYLLAPDSLGLVNGNDFTKKFVNSVTEVTIAHEFQHLINFGRRRYLNPNAPQAPAELWLNEGLSHMAEELLYYLKSGKTPRSNVGGSSLSNADSSYQTWAFYASGDWLNYDEYVFAPVESSPFEAGDDLATRGATWSFLRYLADQTLVTDDRVWYNLVNSGESGIVNLENRFGLTDATLRTTFRDFVVSTYTDDFVSGVAKKYTQPSWDMRSIYPQVTQILGQSFVWPLVGTALNDTQMRTTTLQSGAFKVYRFAGLAGIDSFIKVKGTGGATLPAGITISVVRTQ